MTQYFHQACIEVKITLTEWEKYWLINKKKMIIYLVENIDKSPFWLQLKRRQLNFRNSFQEETLHILLLLKKKKPNWKIYLTFVELMFFKLIHGPWETCIFFLMSNYFISLSWPKNVKLIFWKTLYIIQ